LFIEGEMEAMTAKELRRLWRREEPCAVTDSDVARFEAKYSGTFRDAVLDGVTVVEAAKRILRFEAIRQQLSGTIQP
jgi:hypothetical protein